MGFWKFTNGYEGMCMIGEKFLKEWQVKDKITGSIFSQFASNLLQMTQTKKIISHRFWKFTNGFESMGMSGRKFSKPWQVTDKLLSDFLFTIYIFILWMTQTQEIITHRVLKIHEWIWRDVYEWGESFLNHDKWGIKLLIEYFIQFTFNHIYHNLC